METSLVTNSLVYTYVSCPMCGADRSREVHKATRQEQDALHTDAYLCTNPGYGSHDRIVQCLECRLVYANPRPSSNAILDSYKIVEDPIYLAEQDGRRLTFQLHARHLEKIVGPSAGRSLLDVGCYTGVFVEVALSRGWKARGVEPSHWAASYAQSQGLPVIEGTLETAQLPDDSEDVVTLWDVIEHLPNPLEQLREVARVTKSGGWTVLHTMDIDSLAARLMGERWPWFMDMHVVYFSQRTLATMLQQVGFEPVHSGAMGRYLRLGYFATRIAALSPLLGKPCSFLVEKLHLTHIPIPINFGDLFTLYARKK